MAKFSVGEIAILWHPEPPPDPYEYEDFSFLHGAEVEILSVLSEEYPEFDYEIRVDNIYEHLACKESELRKKYDGDEPATWETCVWDPRRIPEEVE